MRAVRVSSRAEAQQLLKHRSKRGPRVSQDMEPCPVERCAQLSDELWSVAGDLEFTLEAAAPFDSFARNAAEYLVYLGRPERRSTAARLLYFLTHEPSFIAIVQHLTYLSLARARQGGKFVFCGQWNGWLDCEQRKKRLERVAVIFPRLFNELVDLLGWVMKYPAAAQNELEARLVAMRAA